MPWGLKRYQQARDLHFITFSCYHRAPLLDRPQVARRFSRGFRAVTPLVHRGGECRRNPIPMDGDETRADGNHFDSWPARRLRTQPPQKSRKAGAPGTGTPNSRIRADRLHNGQIGNVEVTKRNTEILRLTVPAVILLSWDWRRRLVQAGNW
jgi:hypothetical protein